ncbi:acyltransferase family protein [Ruania zhangjianzhongii]|uniref:acyltransferase family protein n=1 Tax=Ruania zhangjianzhongii TaxID=2603206 RepID=UPI00143D9D6C|nr:acyltransferase [Ruania zhangjianzhongii]
MASTLAPPSPTRLSPTAPAIETPLTGVHATAVETLPAVATPPKTRAPHRRARDPFIDLVRAGATVAVLSVHWLMPQVAWDGSTLSIGNSLSEGAGWLVTWVLQVLPLLFFAAGAAAGLERPRPITHTLRRRLPRLVLPVLALAGTWLLAALLLPLLGVPATAVERVIRIVPQPLWFLGVYLALMILTPLLRRLVDAVGWAAPVALTLVPVAVDLLRFTGVAPQLAWLNLLAVWTVPYTIGLAYARRGEPRLGARTWWVTSAVALVALITLTTAGPYPISMIGMPGDAISNLGPPTLAALAHGVLLTTVALALRGPLTRLAAGPVRRAVSWVSARSMTLYLWHLTAMFTVVGVALLGLGLEVPTAWTPAWFAQWPLWCAAAAAVLIALVRVYHRFETGPVRR